MTSRDFVYWLQGFFEIENPQNIDAKKTQMIKNHLALVFKHEIDPSMGNEEHQSVLNTIHNNKGDELLDLTLYLKESESPYTAEYVLEKWGPKPGPGYWLDSLHGWTPNGEQYRC